MRHVERATWHGISRRCLSSGKDKRAYADRGIRMCAGWSASFESFLSDMGKRPADKSSIDRIDNNRGYDCGHCDDCVSRGASANCRWANRYEQAANKRGTSCSLCGVDGHTAKTCGPVADARIRRAQSKRDRAGLLAEALHLLATHPEAR